MTILDSAELLVQAKNYSGSGDWLDESGNGHDAQLGSTSGSDTNDPLYRDYDGFKYVALPSTGNGNYLLDSTASADILEEQVATIALWVRIHGTHTFARVFSTRGAQGFNCSIGGTITNEWEVFLDGVSADTTRSYPGSLSQDVWHHVAVTIDHTGAVDEMILYVDGVVDPGGPVDISGTGNYDAADLAIGAQRNGDNAAHQTDIATVEFYKTLATPAQIATASVKVGTLLPLSSPVTVVDFNTDAAADPFATFTDPQSNVYTVNRAATGLVATLIDQAQFLYTTDDYHEIVDDAQLDFAGSEDFTMMVAFRTETIAAGSDVLLAKKDNLTTAAGYALVRNAATGQGIIADGTLDDDDTAATVAARTLHTVAMIRNTADDTVETFLDGVGSGSATLDSTTTTLANALPLRIGATAGTAANFLEGQSVAVAVWRQVLTGAEMREADGLLTGSIPGAIQIQNV